MPDTIEHKRRLVGKFELEKVKECLVCKSEKQRPVIGLAWEGLGFSYCLCERCGFKYMTPRPNKMSYIELFKSNYWQDRMTAKSFATGTNYDRSEIDQMELRMPKYKSVYRKVSRDLKSIMPLNEGTKILEVGCAFGFTLEWLNRDFGCQVYGIEPSELAAKRCRDTGVIEMVGSTAEEYFLGNSQSKEKFDVILFRHVYEAILDLEEITIHLKKRLKDEGILLIYTPNDYFYHLNDPYHPYVFNPETLKYFLARCGFETVKSRHTPTPEKIPKSIFHYGKTSYETVIFAKENKEVSPFPIYCSGTSTMEKKKMGDILLASAELSIKDILALLLNKLKGRIRD